MLVLLALSRLTARKSSNSTFFTGERRSPWYMVAFGMVGASISGVSVVSVPGMVGSIGLLCRGVRAAARLLPSAPHHHLLLPRPSPRKQSHEDRFGVLPAFQDGRSSREVLCCLHHSATLPVRQLQHSLCPLGHPDGGRYMALHPSRRHTHPCMDRLIPDTVHTPCPAVPARR